MAFAQTDGHSQKGSLPSCCQKQYSCHGSFDYSADYIIVGAGTAGSVVAARLAQAGYSVIVLEAGPDTSLQSTDPRVQFDKNLIRIPINLVLERNRFNQDPNSTNCGNWNATQNLANFISSDQNGIYYAYPRGLGAGGSSNMHGFVHILGSLQVYNNIAEVVEDDYWRGDNIHRLYNKIVKILYATPGDGCSTEGWLSIKHTPIEELSQDIADVVVAMVQKPFLENFCNPQEIVGIGNNDQDITAAGNRSYGYQDLLVPEMANTGNIRVIFNTLVSEIILKENKRSCCKNQNKYKAVGVKAYDKAYLQEVQSGAAFEVICPVESCPNPTDCLAINTDQSLPARTTNYIAKKEVIVCCGALQSPQLLMLSGIGPKEHLEDVGIKTKINLPGVGSDLLDHCEAYLSYETNPLVFIPAWQAAFILALNPNLEQINPEIFAVCIASLAAFPENPLAYNTSSLQWYNFAGEQTGQFPLPKIQAIPFNAFIFNFDQTWFGPQYPGNYFDFPRNQLIPNIDDPLDQTGVPLQGATFFSMFTSSPRTFLSWNLVNLVPHVANGTVRLASKDPRISPILHEQLFEDEIAIERIALMIQEVRNVMNNPLIKDKYSIPGQPWEIIPGPNAATVDELKQYIKNWSSWGHHISGTCQMGAVDKQTGKAKNPNTVLDSRCRVLGVDSLRVADTSVYVKPWIHAGNTAIAAYLIGEAVSEFIVDNIN